MTGIEKVPCLVRFPDPWTIRLRNTEVNPIETVFPFRSKTCGHAGLVCTDIFGTSPDVSLLGEHCSNGGTGMRQYRAYLMENGHVWTAIDLSCADDDDAKRQTASLPSGHDVELWQGDRKVALLKSKERFDFH